MENEFKKHKIFGRPRVSQEEKREVKVSVFLTKVEAEELKRNCDESKISPPEFIRRAMQNKKIEPRKSVFDAAALEELRAAGLNVNRTTRELARARTKMLPVDFQKLELILQKQLETLQWLKTRIIDSH